MNNLEPNAYHDVDFDSDETITAKEPESSESENETSESAENDQRTPIEITLLENDRGPVNKTLTLEPDGKIKKTGVANIASGKVIRVRLVDWRCMAYGIENLAPNQAIALGRLRADLGNEAYLTTANNKAELALPSRISRTKGNIIYEAGKPAPVAIDFDDGGMPQSVRDQIKDRGGLIAALESICPALRTAAYISRNSTSSGLTIDATGETKEGGSHHFVMVTDGADAQRFIEDLFDRAWLNGLGWIQIGTAGTPLVRSIIDKCVWDPIRLVFEANPTLGPGLSQDPRPATIHEGVPLVCPPSLTKAEKAKVARLIKAAKEEAGPAGKAQREIWAAGHLTKMLAAGVSPEDAERTLNEWAEGTLYPDAIVDFIKLGEVTVRQILDDPAKYDGEKCHHPIEGADYVAQGKFYAGSKTIFTFGHGGQVFHLKEAKKAPKGDSGVTAEDFYAYMPAHQYIYVPTGEMWPASSVNSRLGKDFNLTLDQDRPVEQMSWAPGKDMVIQDALIADGGWIAKTGVSCFNLYRPPVAVPGDATQAKPWIDHVRYVYPNGAGHIINWCAHRVQFPGVKINHALVLGGAPGVGKDSLLEPVKQAVGPWNFSEVSAKQVMGRFNGFLKSVVLRISEVKDLGEVSRYEFYNHMKCLTAAPPDVLRVDEKNLREHSIMNVTGIVYTTNHRTDSLYLTADDRRHYCDWTELTQGDFAPGYWETLWGWYTDGGYGHVAAYLRELDLSGFNAKAPPLKTDAFWAMVDAGRAPEDSEIADIIDRWGNPPAFSLDWVRERAGGSKIGEWLDDRKNRRQIPHRLEGCGYTAVRNGSAKDGLWKIHGNRQTIYALKELTNCDRLTAANDFIQHNSKPWTPAPCQVFRPIEVVPTKSGNPFQWAADDLARARAGQCSQ
jgi:hypothetical protein